MGNRKRKLTLDRPAAYRIKVPGAFGEMRLDWDDSIMVAEVSDEDGMPITTVTVTVDQAALQGLLRRLYSLGLPLISVVCVECKETNQDD